jgi:hypothetical protein
MNIDNFWKGYADGQPSESIQEHALCSLAVSVLFPHSPNNNILTLPVKQYKDYKPKNTASRADELARWLVKQQNNGLKLVGFSHSHEQEKAAKFGMKFLEELPDTKVEPHFNSYRLFFGNRYIDFPQAVALQYYFYTIGFGALKAGLNLKKEDRKLLILMDRFSGAEIGDKIPGKPFPTTLGIHFLNYIENNSKTSLSIVQENKKINLELRYGTLDWWRMNDKENWKIGKSHPHFVLPDWLAAASNAKHFPDEFLNSFKNKKDGVRAVESLSNLYSVFKSFEIWSMDSSALEYIVPMEKHWKIPQEAYDFIISRATRK